MHNITIYFVGGTSILLEGTPEEATNKLIDWLDGDTNETFKINIPAANKTTCVRKELILFVDVV